MSEGLIPESAEAYYHRGDELGLEGIRLQYGSALHGEYVDLDIRDAVYLRYLLDGAINDYERAVGK